MIHADNHPYDGYRQREQPEQDRQDRGQPLAGTRIQFPIPFFQIVLYSPPRWASGEGAGSITNHRPCGTGVPDSPGGSVFGTDRFLLMR